jgi:hypothetical protein|tara:strand:- start:1687 stop:1986 length:300 start_codon:yes stop_codon:yes gene_type:complete
MDDLKFDNVIEMSKQLEFDFSEKIITFKANITEEEIDKELIRYSAYNGVTPKNLIATQYLVNKFFLQKDPLENKYKLSLIGMHERSLAEKRLESVGRKT